MAERPSVKGAIAKQLNPDGLSVISNCLAIRIIAHYPIPHLLVYLEKNRLSYILFLFAMCLIVRFCDDIDIFAFRE